MSVTPATSQHSVTKAAGVPMALGFLVDDGSGGYTLASTGPATGKLVSDGAGGLTIVAIGDPAPAAGTLLRFGHSYLPRVS